MIGTIQKIADQTREASDPTAFFYGQVTAMSPLTIMVDNRFEISGAAIVLMRGFSAGDPVDHTHKIDPHGHAVPTHTTTAVEIADHKHTIVEGKTEKADPDQHEHKIKEIETKEAGKGVHEHSVAAINTGTTGLTTSGGQYTGLRVGDKVVLLRNAGGQQFLVLGRV